MRFYKYLSILLLCVTSALGQGSRADGAALASNTIVPFPVIRVCAETASGVPCTPTASIFTDKTLTTLAANPFNGDAAGNFFFYAAPGWYTVQVSGPNVSAYTYKVLLAPDVNNMPSVVSGAVTSSNGNAALSGIVRLSQNDKICWRNAANTADICISKNGADAIVGTTTTTSTSQLLTSASPNPATAGTVQLATGDTACWRNTANTGNICMGKAVNDVFTLANGAIGGAWISGAANPAQSGQVRLSAADSMCFRNNANTADICISKNGSDQIVGIAGAATSLTTGTANPAASGLIRLANIDQQCWRNSGNSADLCLSINGNNQLASGGGYAMTTTNAGGSSAFSGTWEMALATGGCNNTTAGAVWDLPTSGAAVPNCYGSNVRKGALDFANTGTPVAFFSTVLPQGLIGNADVRVTWFTSTVSGTVTFNIDAACTTAGAANGDDPVWTAGNFFAPAQQTASATASALNLVTVTNIAWPAGCTAGTTLHLRLKRTDTTGSATTATVQAVDIVGRRTF